MLTSANPSVQSIEETLIQNASKGELEAFNQLVLMYQDIAYNHARALLNDPDSAEDAVQESFVKAFQNMPGFRGGSFRGWLLRIVTNSAYDNLRHSHRHPTRSLFTFDDSGEEIESPAWLADPSASVQDTVEQRECSKVIYKVLDELPEAYRSVLTLVDIHEFDYSEAARLLNTPLGTIKSRLARARLHMRNKLQDGLNANTHLCKPNARYAGFSFA